MWTCLSPGDMCTSFRHDRGAQCAVFGADPGQVEGRQVEGRQVEGRQVSAKVWNNVCNKNNYLKLLLFAIQIYLGIVCKSDKHVILLYLL